MSLNDPKKIRWIFTPPQSTQLRGCLLSQPTEQEYIAHFRTLNQNVIDGYIKFKLVHGEGTSLLVPDLLVADLDGLRWLQPKLFYACQLSFFSYFSAACINMELSSGSLVQVALTSGGSVASLDDSSKVFRCLISTSEGTNLMADGKCSLHSSGDFLLDLYHHTTQKAVTEINKAGHLRGSRWNIQGTRELKNVEYAYFTSLSKIASEQDLAKIAMASSGRIYLLRTNAKSKQEAIPIKVYRQSTLDRTASVQVTVPASLVASAHIYRHAPKNRPVYYEVCKPDIYRVGLLPGKVAPIVKGRLDIPDSDRKQFNYVVLGDADTHEGLIAPFNEEETKSLLHIEMCRRNSFFHFWRSHANSDQVSCRFPDMLQFKDGDAEVK